MSRVIRNQAWMLCGQEQCSWTVTFHTPWDCAYTNYCSHFLLLRLRTTGARHYSLSHSFSRRTKHFPPYSHLLKWHTSSFQTFCQNLWFLAAWKDWTLFSSSILSFLPFWFPSFFFFFCNLSRFYYIRHTRRKVEWVFSELIYNICYINKGIKGKNLNLCR